MSTLRAEPEILSLLREYHYLTPARLARLRGDSGRTEQKNLTRLFQEKKVKRQAFLELDHNRGSATHAYFLIEDHSKRTLDHELDITDYHIALKKFCDKNGVDLVWQQKHMTGKFWPDAYFCFRGLHFFLEIERQGYGSVRSGKPSIVRKAETYHDFYESKDCMKRWGFDKFRVIFQLKEIKPEDFLSRLPKHKMFWVGKPGSLTYQTPKDPERTYSFLDV